MRRMNPNPDESQLLLHLAESCYSKCCETSRAGVPAHGIAECSAKNKKQSRPGPQGPPHKQLQSRLACTNFSTGNLRLPVQLYYSLCCAGERGEA